MMMFDPNELGARTLGFGESAGYALKGYAVVFLGLLALMAVLYVSGAIFKALEKSRPAREAKKADRKAQKAAKKAGTPAPAAPAEAPAPSLPEAPGTAGEVKLFDVPDREAALIMAIVANKLQVPLNELRFKSIKEVKENEV